MSYTSWFWIGIGGLLCVIVYGLHRKRSKSQQALDALGLGPQFSLSEANRRHTLVIPRTRGPTLESSILDSPFYPQSYLLSRPERRPQAARMSDVRIHQNIAHQPRCGTCNRKFAAYHSLRQHQNTVGHRSIQCSCLEPFSSISELEDHILLGPNKMISVATPKKVKTSGQESKNAPTCPVCLSYPHPMTVTACGHLFCKPCITRSIAVKAECPTCRQSTSLPELRNVFS